MPPYGRDEFLDFKTGGICFYRKTYPGLKQRRSRSKCQRQLEWSESATAESRLDEKGRSDYKLKFYVFILFAFV